VPGYKEKKREQQGRSIDRILEVMNVDVEKTPIKITISGTLLAGSGVGASAASCVSLARALNAAFELGYTTEQINRVAWQGEFPYHGVASGVDNTASTYGGLLLFYLKGEEQHFEPIGTPNPFEIVLANSGVTVNTAALDEFIDQQKTSDPALFASRLGTITDEAFQMKKALEAGDWQSVGGIMSENHKLLIEMGMSHETLDEMCRAALQNGALGAKVIDQANGKAAAVQVCDLPHFFALRRIECRRQRDNELKVAMQFFRRLQDRRQMVANLFGTAAWKQADPCF